MVVHPAPGNWTGTLVNALVGRGGDARRGRRRRSAPGSCTGSTRTRRGCSSSPRPMRAHRVAVGRRSPRGASRAATRRVCWGHLTSDALTVEKPLGARPARPHAHGGRHYRASRRARTSCGSRASTPATCCARTCTAGARTRSACTWPSVGHPVVGDDTYGGGGGRRLVGAAAAPALPARGVAALPASGDRRGDGPARAAARRPAPLARGARATTGAGRPPGPARCLWLLRRPAP